MSLDTKILSLAADSSKTARAQLAEVTADQFLAQSREFTEAEIQLFNDIFCKLYEFASAEIKTRVSATFATSSWAPDELLGKMAQDEIRYAAPILAHSEAISEKSLLEVIEEKGTDYQTIIAGRVNIGENITGALIAKENMDVSHALSANYTAKISADNFIKLVEDTKSDSRVAKLLTQRADLPNEVKKIVMAQAVIGSTANEETSKHSIPAPVEEAIDYSNEPIFETEDQKEIMAIINSGNENRFLALAANRLGVTNQKLLNYISANTPINYGILVRALGLIPAASIKVFGLFNRTQILDQREFNKVVNSVFAKMRDSDAAAKLKEIAK